MPFIFVNGQEGERTSVSVTPTEEYAAALAVRADRWVAACGGKEVPFVHQSREYLYVYNPGTGEHGYLDLATDVVSPDEPWSVR